MREKKITLLFSGDFAPLINPKDISENHFEYIQDILKACDLHITNLECPLTLSGGQIEKSGPTIKAHPETINLLMQAKVSIACLANNHIYDYGEEGINDTIKVCKEHNIETAGIVNRPDKQDHWLVREVKGKKIGFLNYCEHEFSVRDIGLLGACGYDPVDAYSDIIRLRPDVDYLIVVYHGGNEYYNLPRPGLKKDFHFLADLGVDAVIGHHTHVIGGYEIYKGKPLIYSLGNFFFPYPGEPKEWYTGMVCSIRLGETTEIILHHYIQCHNDLLVRPLSESDIKSGNEVIMTLSRKIRNDNELTKSWHEYAYMRGPDLAKVVLYSTRIERLMMRIPFYSRLVERVKRRRMISNIIRCKSLSDLLTDYLSLRK